MRNENSSTETLARNTWYLLKTIRRWPQPGRAKTHGFISDAKLVPPAWYIALWRITITLIDTACGIALGLVVAAIAHYTGIEAWVNSMQG
ncbi:MAG: hypothetical protein WBM09_11710 [Gallionella sp.]